VLVNLGGNAVKFTERGEVLLRLECLAEESESLRVRFAVIDTGVGIAPESQSRIFEQFTQEDASTTRRFGGTGLGLAIARQLVELMGGRLELVSAPNAGSTFSFELTVNKVALAMAPEERQLPAGLRTLVACANASARLVIGRALHAWGGAPTAVGSLAEAQAELRRGGYRALIVDDALTEGGDADLLSLLVMRGEGEVRTVRLNSFVKVAPVGPPGSATYDVELTKPLRLSQLKRALAGERHDETMTGRAHATDAERNRPPLSGRVLVVEDQPLNREVAVGMLSALGLEAETVDNGRQALIALSSLRFDLVLMDCEMPVMDGYAAAAEWRRREPPGTHVPIIALTADATNAGREACLSAGMDDHLAKPFTRAALEETLRRHLAAARRAPEHEPLLDRATLEALRALPRRGERDMLSHIAERYLTDSQPLVEAIERAARAGAAADLARAAHAWRSYNGNLGAHALARLCRELEERGRRGDIGNALELLAELHALHARVRQELELEMRKSA
jgi:CheY-like chemotaxis protein